MFCCLRCAAHTQHHMGKEKDGVSGNLSGFWALTLLDFSSENVSMTIYKLESLQWEGSVDVIACKFRATLAEGILPLAQDIIRMLLHRLPLHLRAS